MRFSISRFLVLFLPFLAIEGLAAEPSEPPPQISQNIELIWRADLSPWIDELESRIEARQEERSFFLPKVQIDEDLVFMHDEIQLSQAEGDAEIAIVPDMLLLSGGERQGRDDRVEINIAFDGRENIERFDLLDGGDFLAYGEAVKTPNVAWGTLRSPALIKFGEDGEIVWRKIYEDLDGGVGRPCGQQGQDFVVLLNGITSAPSVASFSLKDGDLKAIEFLESKTSHPVLKDLRDSSADCLVVGSDIYTLFLSRSGRNSQDVYLHRFNPSEQSKAVKRIDGFVWPKLSCCLRVVFQRDKKRNLSFGLIYDKAQFDLISHTVALSLASFDDNMNLVKQVFLPDILTKLAADASKNRPESQFCFSNLAPAPDGGIHMLCLVNDRLFVLEINSELALERTIDVSNDFCDSPYQRLEFQLITETDTLILAAKPHDIREKGDRGCFWKAAVDLED